ncbi:MAG: helix-turn-helix transcriptional regulator [Pseudomonadota bacterium]
MDRRDTSDLFRARLATLLDRSGQRQARFATGIGVDRSALSQLLTGAGARLPRADTLVRIAAVHQVSVDWLLGLSEDSGVASETRGAVDVAPGTGDANETLLAQWHDAARGAKIRYVPATIPDLMRTDDIVRFEYRAGPDTPQVRGLSARGQRAQGAHRRDLMRRADSDLELAMPLQTLQALATGTGVWAGLPRSVRRAQTAQMSAMARDYYPALRLYLFDGAERFSVPYTVFGHSRVAIYAGEIYLLITAAGMIRTMVDHFDDLIRAAKVDARQVPDWIEALPVT